MLSKLKQVQAPLPKFLLPFTRLILLGLFLVITMLQTLAFPGQFRQEAATGHGSQFARWLLTAIVGFWFLLAQIAIIALERILTAIHRSQLHSVRGLRWLDRLVLILGIAAGYGAGVTLFAAIKTEEPGPGVITAAITLFSAATFLVAYFVRHEILRSKTLSLRSGNLEQEL